MRIPSFINRIMVLTVIVCCLGMFTGCGKKEKVNPYVYIPEYQYVDGGCSSVFCGFVTGNDVYYFGVTYDEQGMTSKRMIRCIDLEDLSYRDLHPNLDDGCDIYKICQAPGDRLFLYYSKPEGTPGLCMIDSSDGHVLVDYDINGLFPNLMGIESVSYDKDNNVYIYGENIIGVISPNNEKLCMIPIEEWLGGMFHAPDGNVYIYYTNGAGTPLKLVNPRTRTLDTTGIDFQTVRYMNVSMGYTDDLFAYNDSGFWGGTLADGHFENYFDWIGLNVNSSDLVLAGELPDGRYFALANADEEERVQGEDEQLQLVFIKRIPAEEAEPVKELTYGCLWLDYEYKRQILAFNKSHSDVHISVKEYCSDDISYDDAINALNSDIISGKSPDIINLLNIAFDKYAEKGLFEDLTPYMEDDGIPKEDYLPNLINEFSIDDKMFAFYPCFRINAVCMRGANAEGREGWTLADFVKYFEDVPVQNIFEYGNRSMMFENCLYKNLDEFVNWETGECHFDSEAFIQFLHFANQYDEAFYFSDDFGSQDKIMNNKLYLVQTTISTVTAYRGLNAFFNGDVVFIGYPDANCHGNYDVNYQGALAMSSQTKNKDAAWEFLRMFLEDDFQNHIADGEYSGFPIKESALQRMYDSAMKEETVINPDTGEEEKVVKEYFGISDYSREIYSVSEEDVANLDALIRNLRPNNTYPQKIFDIITEETAPFFNGNKSAEECARIIENRLSIYVSENM